MIGSPVESRTPPDAYGNMSLLYTFERPDL
jgi:hypothetical protein